MAEVLSLDLLLNLAYFASFAVLFLYGQRLQGTAMLVGVGRQLRRLDGFRINARKRFLTVLGRSGVDAAKAEEKVDRLINSFTISPVSLDPSGLVPKLEHVVNTYDTHLKAEVQTLVPRAEPAEVGTLTNLLEVSIGLDTMFRIVRHYYLLARKQGGMLALAQLQMALPTIMQEAEAYQAALDAFAKGESVGDGVGVLAAAQLAGGVEGKEVVKDTVVYDTTWEGRRLLVVRAKGPGGNVGRPGLAVEQLIKEQGPIALVVTLDAALKLEGEVSGEVAEGIGAAIGGPGTERYRIEEAAVKHAVPLIAIVVKMSSKEAISTMTKPLRDAVEELLRRVRRAVLAGTKPGDTTIVAGVGNTIGIA